MKVYAVDINGSIDYAYLEKSRAIEDIALMTEYDTDYVENQIEDYGAVDDFYSIKEIDVLDKEKELKVNGNCMGCN